MLSSKFIGSLGEGSYYMYELSICLSDGGPGGGSRGPQGLSKEGHWAMVYEYGYEKQKDHRTESKTEGKIQYIHSKQQNYHI